MTAAATTIRREPLAALVGIGVRMNVLRSTEKLHAFLIDEAAGLLGARRVLLVLDGTTGQNGLEQARKFTESSGVTGIVLTKLDGTAKGGVVVSITRELGLPIRYIGIGEQVGDLLPFDPETFIDSIFPK